MERRVVDMPAMVCTVCGLAAETKSGAAGSVPHCGCGGLLEVQRDFRHLDADRLKALFHERLSLRTGPYASGVWRYKELIDPELPEQYIVTRGEGNTGLYDSQAAARYAGVRRLWLKVQGDNPSGSFKDNGMTAAVSRGIALGYKAFACASTGNTSSSLAMYAALAGARCCVLVPPSGISPNKVAQTAAYGAELYPIAGGYDEGVAFLDRYGERLGLYVCNSVNPFRVEGQKSIVFEAAQTLGWKLPDWIVLPGGALSNAAALGKGLRELRAAGLIEQLPRIAIIQAEGASPFHRMMADGSGVLCPEPNPETIATALKIGHPPGWRKAARILRETNGVTASVSDDEIMAAKEVIDRSGIGCEPASAAALAGLRKLAASGTIDKEETAMVILTGHLLKDTGSAAAGMNADQPMDAERLLIALAQFGALG